MNGRRLLTAAACLLVAAPLSLSGAAAAFGLRLPEPAGATAPVVTVQSPALLAEQSMRVDRVEDQIRQLNGRIEELTYQLQQLQEMIRRMQEDTEYRFQELEGVPTQRRSDSQGIPAPAGQIEPPAQLGEGFSIEPDDTFGQPPRVLGTLPATGDPAGGGFPASGPLDLSAIARGDVFQGSGQGTGQGTGQDTGAVLQPAPPLGADPSLLPPLATSSEPQGGQLPPPPDPIGQQVAVATDEDPRVAFNRAYEFLRAGEYEMAEAGFKRYLQAGGGPMAGDAHYWIGESLYARGDFRAAADAFLTTYRDYPGIDKAPESLLKLGMSLQGLEETDAACATYRELEKKFSTASQALLDRVASQKSKAGC